MTRITLAKITASPVRFKLVPELFTAALPPPKLKLNVGPEVPFAPPPTNIKSLIRIYDYLKEG